MKTFKHCTSCDQKLEETIENFHKIVRTSGKAKRKVTYYRNNCRKCFNEQQANKRMMSRVDKNPHMYAECDSCDKYYAKTYYDECPRCKFGEDSFKGATKYERQ